MKLIKPIIFYAVALYIGCLAYILLKESILIGAVLAASFLIIIFFTIEKKFAAIIFIFFILGAASTFSYYNINSLSKIETIRITQMEEFYSIGTINNRTVLLKGNLQGLMEGDKILGNGSFDYKPDYLKGRVGEFYVDKYKLYKKDLVSQLNFIKRKTYDKFLGYLGEKNTAIIMSLCFGETSYLSESQKDDFKNLGVVHAVSVSGFHMAIIYKLLEGILGIWPSMFISFVYVILTGAQPATIRAFIMILILKLSKKLYKNYDGLSALSLSSIIILISRPFYAVNLGFMLSYLSTLGIILYYNKIRRAFYKLPKSINESLSITLSAQVFSAPYASLAMQNVSFGFILGNLILLPMYTWLVVAGNAALILMNIDFLFKLLCKFIGIIIIILEGAQFVLLKITPSAQYVSYIESIALLSIIISFILVKKGFNKFKSVPIVMLVLILSQYYSFFPKIQYVNAGAVNAVVVGYRTEKILIYNGNRINDENLKVLKERFRITKLADNSKQDVIIRLKKNYSIRTINKLTFNKNSIDLEVFNKKFKTIMSSNTEAFEQTDLNETDVIILPKNRYYYSSISLTQRFDIKSFKIMFNRVYSVRI